MEPCGCARSVNTPLVLASNLQVSDRGLRSSRLGLGLERLSFESKPLVGFITFCVSRSRRKMYCGHARLCVCLSVCLSAAVRPHYCTHPDVTWRRGRGCPLVVHYWADIQSVHGLRCYGNITRTLVTSLRPSRDMTTLGGACARCWPVTGG